MKVLEFLKQHSLSELEETYKIRVVRSALFPELFLLKYSQIESPVHERIVQECRALILKESLDGFKVVSRSFDKFFNLGEPNAPKLI